MKFTILGSGGANPTPRAFCQCTVCKKARRNGEPYKRNCSSLFVNDINTLIDCGEDIGDSVNRRNIKQVDNLFITHWHPDHTFGLRIILEANCKKKGNVSYKMVHIYIPKNVYKTLKQNFPVIDYFVNIQKTGKLHLIEDGQKINIKDITVKVIGYRGKVSDTYAYLFECGEKKVLYAPCDTISFNRYINFNNLDLVIHECGLFSDDPSEISFKTLMCRLKEIKPKKVILTHIEEGQINYWGEKYLKSMIRKYSDINFVFGYDGMEIKV
ncbi:MAG: MBL fold metallo-hydrolase [Euryarchaeota archaeon]|nr:MBL fold metallo-hydrolase [Euryarchaeota archaeon]